MSTAETEDAAKGQDSCLAKLYRGKNIENIVVIHIIAIIFGFTPTQCITASSYKIRR
jgi:hypothetical protein